MSRHLATVIAIGLATLATGCSDEITDRITDDLLEEVFVDAKISGAPTSISPGDAFTLSAAQSSSIGDRIRDYSWSISGTGAAYIEHGSTSRETIALEVLEPPSPVQVRIGLRVRDTGGLEDSTSISFFFGPSVVPTPPPQGPEPFQDPFMPTPDLDGEDLDRNGVRDSVQRDVEILLQREPERIPVAMALAEGLQSTLVPMTEAEAVDAQQAISEALACLQLPADQEGVPAADVLAAVSSRAFDSVDRYLAHLRYSETLPSGTYRVPVRDEIDCGAISSKHGGRPNQAKSHISCDLVEGPEYRIITINGVNTDATGARSNADALRGIIPSLHNGRRTQVYWTHNRSFGIYADLAEVLLVQKAGEYDPDYAKLMFELVSGRIGNDYEDFNEELAKEVVSGFLAVTGASMADEQTLGRHEQEIALMEADIREHAGQGNMVLLVPHSQGNLFANEIYERVVAGDTAIDALGIRIAGFASPSSYVAGGGDYVTHNFDLVIAGLEALYPVLPPNASALPLLGGDPFGHNFRTVYLHPAQLQTSRGLIFSSLDQLSPPTPQVRAAAVTIRLDWGNQIDFDLHVFEPGVDPQKDAGKRGHVYYRQPAGDFGFLDRDDVFLSGPEHYYADCITEPGQFVVAVNFFRGFGVGSARVTITTPFSSRSIPATFPEPLGEAGNLTPTPIALLNVTKSPSGSLRYAVAPLVAP